MLMLLVLQLGITSRNQKGKGRDKYGNLDGFACLTEEMQRIKSGYIHSTSGTALKSIDAIQSVV